MRWKIESRCSEEIPLLAECYHCSAFSSSWFRYSVERAIAHRSVHTMAWTSWCESVLWLRITCDNYTLGWASGQRHGNTRQRERFALKTIEIGSLISAIYRSSGVGVHSFQVFMAYPETFMLHDDELFQVFTKCRELGAIALVHAENGSLIKELEKELSKLGITGPEGHLLSRPEKARTRDTTRIRFQWVPFDLAGGWSDQSSDHHRRTSSVRSRMRRWNRQTWTHFVGRCPLYVVRVMSKSVADKIQEARSKGREKRCLHLHFQFVHMCHCHRSIGVWGIHCRQSRNWWVTLFQ